MVSYGFLWFLMVSRGFSVSVHRCIPQVSGDDGSFTTIAGNAVLYDRVAHVETAAKIACNARGVRRPSLAELPDSRVVSSLIESFSSGRGNAVRRVLGLRLKTRLSMRLLTVLRMFLLSVLLHR